MFCWIPVQLFVRTEIWVIFTTIVLASGSLFLITVVSWLVDGHKRNINPISLEGRLHFVVRVYCMLDLAIIVGWGTWFAHSRQGSDFPLCRHLLQILSIIGASGIGAASYNCYRTWLNPNRGTSARLEETGIAIVFLLFYIVLGAILEYT
jgi:hypothetical protein